MDLSRTLARAAMTAAHLTLLPLLTATAALGQLPGPSLILLDTLILQEDAEYFVSAPVGVLQGSDGSYLIPDAFANAILQFDGDGRFVRAFGGPGQGPGEFTGVARAMRVGGLVGAVDLGGMEIEVFDYQTGEAVGSIGLSPSMSITSMTEVSDSVWIAGMDRDTWMSVGTVAATELLTLARTGSRESLRLDRIAVPSPYQTNPIMFGALGHAFLNVGETDIVVGFLGRPICCIPVSAHRSTPSISNPACAGARRPKRTYAARPRPWIQCCSPTTFPCWDPCPGTRTAT